MLMLNKRGCLLVLRGEQNSDETRASNRQKIQGPILNGKLMLTSNHKEGNPKIVVCFLVVKINIMLLGKDMFSVATAGHGDITSSQLV